MADSGKQPMILVKKPDGTFERVPLSSIQKSSPATPAPVTAPSAAPVSAPAPHTTKPATHHSAHTHTAHTTHHAATKPVAHQGANHAFHGRRPAAPTGPATPPTPTIIPESPKPAPRQPRARSVIDELEQNAPDIETIVKGTPAPNRQGQVSEILRMLPFKVPADSESRLRTLLQLFLKDIRSSDQTREVLMRPLSEGGIGFTKNQAQSILSIAEEVNGRLLVDTESVPTLKPRAGGMVFQHGMPRVSDMPALKPRPVAPQLASAAAPQQAAALPTPAPAVRPVAAPSTNTPPPPKFSLHETQATRPVMHDVVVKPTTMGPVDEIKYLTTEDFRRLGKTPPEACDRLFQKFMDLKDESILLFLQALDAWRQSPVYNEYAGAATQALATGTKLALQTTNAAMLQWNEMKALIALEKKLAL